MIHAEGSSSMFREVYLLLENLTRTACDTEYRNSQSLGAVAAGFREVAPGGDAESGGDVPVVRVLTPEMQGEMDMLASPSTRRAKELEELERQKVQVELEDDHHRLQVRVTPPLRPNPGPRFHASTCTWDAETRMVPVISNSACFPF
jgi:hypothetical protein